MPPRFGWKIDSRDGKVYRTVLMPDGLWWLAEDVVYADVQSTNGTTPPAPGYYTWAEAVQACIPGCRIPTKRNDGTGDDWQILADAVGGTSVAGLHLKATSGWSTNGDDLYGFNAINKGFYSRIDYSLNWYFSASDGTNYWGDWPSSPEYSSGIWLQNGLDASGIFSVSKDFYLGQLDSAKRVRLRLIVDSGNIPDPDPVEPLRLTNIVNPLTVKLLSHNSNFRPVTKLNRNSFALGSFAFEGNADWDVDNDTPYEDLVGGIYENFPIGLTDTEVVIEELFKVTHNEFSKRLSAKCVFIPQDYDFNDDIFIGLNSGFSEDSCTIIASDTMSSAKFGSKRGVMLKGSWTVSTIGAAQFIAWLRRNIGKRFVKTISTFAGYVWTIGEDVSFTIDCELVTISASFYGVDKARTLDVTWEKHPEDALLITGTFDNSTITSTAVNRLGETVPSFVVNNGDGTVSVFLDGNPDGDYRICIMQNNKVTPWIDLYWENVS